MVQGKKKPILKYESAEKNKITHTGILSGCICMLILSVVMCFMDTFTISSVIYELKTYGVELLVWSCIIGNVYALGLTFGIRSKMLGRILLGIFVGEVLALIVFIIGVIVNNFRNLSLITIGNIPINLFYLVFVFISIGYGVNQIHHIIIMNKCIKAFRDAMNSFKERGL